jgi:hypothetical protein
MFETLVAKIKLLVARRQTEQQRIIATLQRIEKVERRRVIRGWQDLQKICEEPPKN